YLNLARVLVDGEKLYFPTVEEAEVLLQQEALARSGLVDINRADLSGLCTLPGIGESRAADIIAYREQQGLFSTVEDLLKVDCITESIYNKLADKITVGQ
ncbi:MAG: helix-hairpin-helix domain-containing protein, partial [Lachnospiraceae bacterium]|nr:helix-hairpin-helix domain-containing protein [Lachnospiraceae bacterium]